MSSIQWKHQPDGHDYDAADDYLSLLMTDEQAGHLATQLMHETDLVWHPAKDLIRAAGFDTFGILTTPRTKLPEHVRSNLDKIKAGEHLSPILLVAGDRSRNIPLTVADGWHRVLAAYLTDENAVVPARIARQRINH